METHPKSWMGYGLREILTGNHVFPHQIWGFSMVFRLRFSLNPIQWKYHENRVLFQPWALEHLHHCTLLLRLVRCHRFLCRSQRGCGWFQGSRPCQVILAWKTTQFHQDFLHLKKSWYYVITGICGVMLLLSLAYSTGIICNMIIIITTVICNMILIYSYYHYHLFVEHSTTGWTGHGDMNHPPCRYATERLSWAIRSCR